MEKYMSQEILEALEELRLDDENGPFKIGEKNGKDGTGVHR